jgi:hypothetical protein
MNNSNIKGGKKSKNSWINLPDSTGADACTNFRIEFSSSNNDNTDDIDVSTLVEGLKCDYAVGADFSNIDNDMKENLLLLQKRSADGHTYVSHIPLFTKPKPRQFWMPKVFGGSSSLSHSHEERAATTNDLVLDLIMVYILNVLATLTVQKAEYLYLNGNKQVSTKSHRLLSNNGEALQSDTNSTDIHSGSQTKIENWKDSEIVHAAIIDTAALFIPLFFQWIRLARALNKYEQNDVVHLFFFLINMIVFTLLGRSVFACGSEAETNGGKIGDAIHRLPCYNFVGFLQLSIFTVILYLMYVRKFNTGGITKLAIDFEISILGFKILLYSFIHIGLYRFLETDEPFWFVVTWWTATSFEILSGLVPAAMGLCSKVKLYSMKHTCICLRLCHKIEEEQDRNLGALIPLNVHLSTERLSLFVILSLGEFLAGADVGGKSHFEGQWKVSIAVIILMVAIKFTVLDLAALPTVSKRICSNMKKKGVKHAEHAFSVSYFRGFSFLSLYIGINFAILLFAGSFDALTHYRHFGKLHRSLTGIASFLILFTTTLQQLCHRGASERRIRKEVRVTIRFLFSFIMILIPIFFESLPEQYENDKKEIDVNFACIFIMIYATLFYIILLLDRWMRTPTKEMDTSKVGNH